MSGARVTPGTGLANVATGVPLLDHLLVELARAGRFDLSLEIEPDEPVAEVDAAGAAIGQALAPLLPPLLDRLRSLRAVHADAASAADALDRLERGQADMAAEIAQWREGLDRVERAVERGEKSMAGNRDVVEGWVRELEDRIARLG